MPNDTEILHESISQLMQNGFPGKIRGGLSLEKHDFNLDEPLLSSHCQGCQNRDSCPWISVSDCVTAETDAWFGHLFIDPHLD